MQEITLAQMLQAREERVCKQQYLLNTHHCPIICFTMNIAGPVKTSPLIERAFTAGLAALDSHLPEEHIRFRDTDITATGCQALYAVDSDALTLKKICTAIEDATPLGRLFDMDVLNTDGTKLDRAAVGGNSRDCIVCGAAGRGCAARRLHTVPQLQAATRAIISQHFARTDREHIAALAVQSLVDEVHTTPKPGLVDRRNNGSHTDMDVSTFLASANALESYFQECVKIGQETCNLTPETDNHISQPDSPVTKTPRLSPAAPLSPADTFSLLRQAGIAAEAAMYKATGGVNTHKGIIYTMGVLCGSLGRLWTPEHPIADTEAVLAECARMVEHSVKSDFASINSSLTDTPTTETPTTETSTTDAADNPTVLTNHFTAGLRLYQEQGLTGIRGEVAAGLPSVINIGLPAYKKALQAGLSANDAGAVTLLHLIAGVKDTNLYHRGGNDGAAYAASAAQNLLAHAPYPSARLIEALDDAFIARNLSPGGCADLLAVTYFLFMTSSFDTSIFPPFKTSDITCLG